MARHRRKRRDNESFGLSFLDAICCGFGAIVLLLVLTKTAEPTIIEDRGTGLESIATELASLLPDLDGQLDSLQQKLADRQKRLAEARLKLAALKPEAQAAQDKRADSRLEAQAASTIEQRLAIAKQELTEEMKRLYARQKRTPNYDVGGIPIDSEYIIFVIDTSGSMQLYAWEKVVESINETLNIYPRVKGIQVLSDMGTYMFPNYSAQWIPDSRTRRRQILEELREWAPFSNSSPVEGITQAISDLKSPDKRISIYVLGDEFSGVSIQGVLDTVKRNNPKDSQGKPWVRIHAIGFPLPLTPDGKAHPSGIRFATLMRNLCHENGGTFVGLKYEPVPLKRKRRRVTIKIG